MVCVQKVYQLYWLNRVCRSILQLMLLQCYFRCEVCLQLESAFTFHSLSNVFVLPNTKLYNVFQFFMLSESHVFHFNVLYICFELRFRKLTRTPVP